MNYAANDEHFPWHYTEFGVLCACGLPMDRDEKCKTMRQEEQEPNRDQG